MERALLDRAIVGELRAALNEALRLKPDVAATLDSRGLTYLKMGQWDSAIDDYSSALTRSWRVRSTDADLPSSRSTAGGNADIAEAKTIAADIVGEFARYGVQ
jgi:tetratricopeptide (TPR) repeat protein